MRVLNVGGGSAQLRCLSPGGAGQKGGFCLVVLLEGIEMWPGRGRFGVAAAGGGGVENIMETSANIVFSLSLSAKSIEARFVHSTHDFCALARTVYPVPTSPSTFVLGRGIYLVFVWLSIARPRP